MSGGDVRYVPPHLDDSGRAHLLAQVERLGFAGQSPTRYWNALRTRAKNSTSGCVLSKLSRNGSSLISGSCRISSTVPHTLMFFPTFWAASAGVILSSLSTAFTLTGLGIWA